MPGTFTLFIALMAFLTSDGGMMSMLRSSAAGGGRQVHLSGRGSGFHRSAQPIYRPVHVRL